TFPLSCRISFLFYLRSHPTPALPSFPTRRSSDLEDSERGRVDERRIAEIDDHLLAALADHLEQLLLELGRGIEIEFKQQLLEVRSEEHTSELQSRVDLVCRLLLEKKK